MARGAAEVAPESAMTEEPLSEEALVDEAPALTARALHSLDCGHRQYGAGDALDDECLTHFVEGRDFALS